MRQVCIPRYGRPDVFRLQDVPEPPLTPAGVRIAVHVSGVNFADVLARQGLYPDCPKPPVVVGYEVAGYVLEVGADVTGLISGQRVVALTRFGGYADQVVVPSDQVFALPDNMPFTDAAALPVNYLTAYLMLYVCGHLQTGEHVLIHGGAGGVGLAAIQLCRLREAKIYATASLHKHAFLQQQGVHHTFAYAPKTLLTTYSSRHGWPRRRYRPRSTRGPIVRSELPTPGAVGPLDYVWGVAFKFGHAPKPLGSALACAADAPVSPHTPPKRQYRGDWRQLRTSVGTTDTSDTGYDAYVVSVSTATYSSHYCTPVRTFGGVCRTSVYPRASKHR